MSTVISVGEVEFAEWILGFLLILNGVLVIDNFIVEVTFPRLLGHGTVSQEDFKWVPSGNWGAVGGWSHIGIEVLSDVVSPSLHVLDGFGDQSALGFILEVIWNLETSDSTLNLVETSSTVSEQNVLVWVGTHSEDILVNDATSQFTILEQEKVFPGETAGGGDITDVAIEEFGEEGFNSSIEFGGETFGAEFMGGDGHESPAGFGEPFAGRADLTSSVERRGVQQ